MATAAPAKAKQTYFNIPPPPLPEFYLPKKSERGNGGSDAASDKGVETNIKIKKTKSGSKQKRKTVVTFDEQPGAGDTAVAKLPAAPEEAADDRMRKEIKYSVYRTTSAGPAVTFLTPPPGAADDIPPLAVYHICRICLRPRSARYHREHPIPIDGVPPPPGICRRCRVTSVEDVTKVATVVKEAESNAMRIGIGCVIPDEDYVSNAEMCERRGNKLMPTCAQLLHSEPRQRLVIEEDGSESTGTEQEIVYRHVRVRGSTSSSPPARPMTSVKSTAQDAIDAVSVGSEHTTTTRSRARSKTSDVPRRTRRRSQSVTVRSHVTASDDVGFRQIGRGAVATREAGEVVSNERHETQMATYTTSAGSATASCRSPSRAVARASTFVAIAPQPGYTESDIRKMAREEVVKYRQAERRLDGHPEAYAHGRIVSVERRIEKQADVAEPMPWSSKTEKVEFEVVRKSKGEAPEVPTMRQEPMEYEIPVGRPVAVANEDRAYDDRGYDRGIIIERIDAPNSRVTASGYDSSSGWASYQPEKYQGTLPSSRADTTRPSESKSAVMDPALDQADSSAPPNSGRTELRSNRSERRKWDVASTAPDDGNVMSPLPTTNKTEPRSERSDRRKWDAMTESGRVTELAQSIPPVSSKLREVYRYEDDGQRPESDRYNVIEVIKEVEVPSRSRKTFTEPGGSSQRPLSQYEREMPDRILEVKRDSRQGGNQRPSQNSAAETNRREREEVRYRKEHIRGEATPSPRSLSSRSVRQPDAQRASDSREPEPADREPDQVPRTRAFNLRCAAAAGGEAPPSRDEPDARRSDTYRGTGKTKGLTGNAADDDADSDRTIWPGTAREHRNARSARSPEREYIYTERVIRRAAPQPQDEQDYQQERSRRYMQTEELLRTSKCSTAGSRVDGQATSQPASKVDSRAGPSQEQSQTSRYSGRPKQQVAKVGDGSEHSKSSRVRFASKVDVSPTPPDSNADSEQFRHIGAQIGTKKRMQGGESAEDLIAEYEERYRGRSRSASRAPSGAIDGTSEQEYFFERKATKNGGHSGGEGKSKGKEVDGRGSGYQPSKSRPLATAFSESPSRERHSDSPSPERFSGHGPYRPEMPRPHSMDPQWASGHGSNVRADKRFGHSRGQWAEGSSAPGSHVRW